MYNETVKPGITFGVYPLNDEKQDNLLDQFVENTKLKLTSVVKPETKQICNFICLVEDQYNKLNTLDNIQVEKALIRLHQGLSQRGIKQGLLVDAFAIIKYFSKKYWECLIMTNS